MIDPDGWLRTGDVAVMDERGFVRITDRMKDVVIVGGFNVYPAEVERVLVRASRRGVGRRGRRRRMTGWARSRSPSSCREPACRRDAGRDRRVGGDRMANFKVPRRVVVRRRRSRATPA